MAKVFRKDEIDELIRHGGGWWTLQEAAEFTGISGGQFRTYVREGVFHENVKGYGYPAGIICKQRVAFLKAQRQESNSERTLDLQKEKAKKERVLLERAQFQLDVETGAYAPITIIEATILKVATVLASQFEAFSSRIRFKLPGLTVEQLDSIRAAISEFRNELADLDFSIAEITEDVNEQLAVDEEEYQSLDDVANG